MWKKENEQSSQNENKPNVETSYQNNPSSITSRIESASIGHTISIEGTISGEEDLVIQGKVKGEIKLKKNTLSVGRNGSVEASISAKSVKVDGEVKGDIEGSERIIINESGRVLGNIKSPRVVLKDGSSFKGNIDMQNNEVGNKNNQGQNKPATFQASSQKSTTLENKNQSNNANQKKPIDLKNL